MKVDKVNFIEKKVKGMPKKKFIDAHMPIVWPKMKPEDRQKKLSEVYESIVGKTKQDDVSADTDK